VYQRPKKSDEAGPPASDPNRSRRSGSPDTGALKQSLLPHEEVAAIRDHVEGAANLVDHRIQKGGLPLPRELAPVAAALTALNFPVIGGSTGFGNGAPRFTEEAGIKIRSSFPLIVIGESPRPFELRFSGHEDAFRSELDSISVPLAVRIRYPLAVGLKGLTPTNVGIALDPDMKLKHPALVEAVERAYHRSALATSLSTPLEDEIMRRECNVAIALRLNSYLKDFRADHRASVGVPMTMLGTPGDPIQLYAGNPLDPDPSIRDLSGNSLRSRIISDRLSAMLTFASFLKDRALRGD